MFCLSDLKQLYFSNQLTELNTLSYQQLVKFLKLLEANFDINPFIPKAFINKYYSDLGHDRNFNLASILSSLIIMHIFKIPITSLLCIFLALSAGIEKILQFDSKTPDETFFSRFKTTFEKQIAELFNSLAFEVIEICDKIYENLPKDSLNKRNNSKLIYDTLGLKPKVKENNPKTLVSEINKQNFFAKVIKNSDFNPYAVAYKNMPKYAQCNLNIHFFDEEFYSTVKSEFDTPEEQKYEFDNASLRPVLFPHQFNIYSR